MELVRLSGVASEADAAEMLLLLGFRTPFRFTRRPLATGELSAFFFHLYDLRFLVLVFMSAPASTSVVPIEGGHYAARARKIKANFPGAGVSSTSPARRG